MSLACTLATGMISAAKLSNTVIRKTEKALQRIDRFNRVRRRNQTVPLTILDEGYLKCTHRSEKGESYQLFQCNLSANPQKIEAAHNQQTNIVQSNDTPKVHLRISCLKFHTSIKCKQATVNPEQSFRNHLRPAQNVPDPTTSLNVKDGLR